jgi:hypothetical protein
MNLTIDITIDNVGTTMWVEDTSEWNSLIGGQTYDYFVATQTVTFTNYIDSAGTTTDLNVACIKDDPTSKWMEITPKEVNSAWTAFPEGLYNIQYAVTVQTQSPVIPEPANNGSYYYQQFIFWEINNYMSNLLVDIANNYNGITNPDTLVNSGALKDDYLYRYAIMFGTKFEALQAAIAVSGSTTTVTAEYVSQAINTMLILQKLMSQYPDGNYTRRFIK